MPDFDSTAANIEENYLRFPREGKEAPLESDNDSVDEPEPKPIITDSDGFEYDNVLF